MVNPRVSVIVPAYNVEGYITQCLDSLIVQDLPEIEIIVVNDGSTDQTGQLAARYAESHARVRVVNQDNHGLSEARNAGIRQAKGEFLGFVDSDDWVHASMYSDLLQLAEQTAADLVIVNGHLYDDLTKELRPIQDSRVWSTLGAGDRSGPLDPRTAPDLFMLDTSACKRLYRRAFLDRLGFAFMPGKIFEDVPAHYKLLLNTPSVALLDRPYYYYRTNRAGRITAKSDETLLQVFDVLGEVVRELTASRADHEIWASFIWFQSWVLRWLRNQITPLHAPRFDDLCHEFSKSFGKEATGEFERKFATDTPAIEFAARQRAGTLQSAMKPIPPDPYWPYAGTRHLGNDRIGFFNKDPNTYMPDVWGWVCIQYGIGSVLDIGCGIATNLVWFDEYGFDVLGVEGHPRAVSGALLPEKVIQHDFSKGPWQPEHDFDLCLCTEFAEHVGQEYEENWMAAVDRCRYLLLSAAAPGQRGYHHVNEQPDEYWIGRFGARGFTHLPQVSLLLRETCARKPAAWGRNQLLLFRREPPMPAVS